MTRELRLFIAGFGVVGQALAARLILQREIIRKREDLCIDVVGIADSKGSVVVGKSNRTKLDIAKVLATKRSMGVVSPDGEKGTPDVPALLDSTGADVFVELAPAGGPEGEPGLSHIRGALERGEHVVTANKMPLALRYGELVGAARRRHLALRYGACVGGGVPVIEFGDLCAHSDTITRTDGVLNATSNFILTKMEEGSLSFQEALAAAKRAGYSETDPSLDIDGVDAACKIVILSNHVFGTSLSLNDVADKEGIRGVTQRAVRDARRRGAKIRMVASFEKRPSVHLRELSDNDPLALDGPNNAVRFRCSGSGDRVALGRAGGGVSTSSAVLRDIIQIGNMERDSEGRGAAEARMGAGR